MVAPVVDQTVPDRDDNLVADYVVVNRSGGVEFNLGKFFQSQQGQHELSKVESLREALRALRVAETERVSATVSAPTPGANAE